ncbi:hypothetical protein CHS0354_035513 [Potamilus streckersoni]|uniref:Mitochondria-eating protein C-terminal domain-containing protein n=1 Tax=Potamilus streckersoni TaxID=2493646 RepID=A0AAE0VJS0_9BIVA|nr:hypothetical protein CHS0354_035513 [Potamilus streckersoni]
MGCGASFSGPSIPLTSRGKDVEINTERRILDIKSNGPNANPSDKSGLQLERSSDSGISTISTSSTNESIQEVTKTAEQYKMIIADLKAEVQNLREEKDALLKRLSGIGAVWLTDNNPNITDLSDENRPEKLLEQFSEIYDNEWTDGFEYLTKVEGCREQSSIQHLLSILEFQKGDELVLKETEKKLHEHRGKSPHQCLALITKVIGQKLLKNGFENKVYGALDKYIQGCIRICWFMCVRNPQMHLYFGQNLRKEGRRYFEDKRFVSYKRSGKYVKYFVWPAVFLHEDGPMLKKGVAQGRKKSKTRKRKSKNRVRNMPADVHDENLSRSNIKDT